MKPKIVECDLEIVQQKPGVKKFLSSIFIKVEPSAAYTQAQNGGAERVAAVIKEKVRSMAQETRFPPELWPEICDAAIYLYNRTPRLSSDWKTPYDKFFSRLAVADRVIASARKPDRTHLRVYGCKAYAMTTDAMKKDNRLERLNPKAWIGYLIGYASSNIYRIWNPHTNRIVSTRDVNFDEEEVYSGDPEEVKKDKRVALEQLEKVLNRIDLDNPERKEGKKLGKSAGFEEIEVIPVAELEAVPPVSV